MPEKPLALIARPEEVEGIIACLDGSPYHPVCVDFAALCHGIRNGDLSSALISDRAMDDGNWQGVADAVSQQPAWSDFPIVVIAAGGALDGKRKAIEALGNVNLVQRPVDPPVLINAVRTSLRARGRQRQAQQMLLRLERQEAHLEAEVNARTADLTAANTALKRMIWERAKVERKLRESEELHRSTVELSGQFAWTASSNGRILSASPGFRRVTGMALEIDPHEGFISSVHPDDLPEVLVRWERAKAEQRVGYSDFRVRMADGTYRMFRARAMPRMDDSGQLVRWYGVLEDVHAHREAEAARQRAEERYQLAAMATNDAIWEYDFDAGLIHWGETAGEVLGFSEPLGTTRVSWWKERVHPDDRDEVARTLAAVVDSGDERWSGAYRFLSGSGEYRLFYDRGFVMRDKVGKALQIVGAMADITERHRAEEEMLRMQSELIHVSRLSAMGTMASTLAHELNQPLTAVTSYLRGARHLLVSKAGADMDQVAEALEHAESGALRAGQIVRRLRDLVAKGTAAMRPENLPKLIDDAGTIAFLDAAFYKVTRHFDLEERAAWVNVDRIQIQQVLINLVRNAMQAMQQCPVRDITIRTRCVSAEQVEISVLDTGTGIPPEVRSALFSPFQGTKAEGLGIGLSISRTIVEAHGGKIWAEDRPEGGAVFCFTVPAARTPKKDTGEH